MYVLGLSAYAHEASCALLKDGRLIAHAEEERFSREKHTWKFPEHAIRFCLARAGISFGEVTHVAFFWQPAKELAGNLGHFLRYFPRSLNLFSAPSGHEDVSFFGRQRLMRRVGDELRLRFALSGVPKIHFVEHHLAHAASAFFCSRFAEAAILTIDGRGESSSALLAHGRGTHLQKREEISVPHSLGHLYAAVTDYLGFKPFFDEWKVMGLSAYGGGELVGKFRDVIRFDARGLYSLNLEYFSFHTHGQSRWLSDKFLKAFGPKRNSRDEITRHHQNIAFALQRLVEEAGVKLAMRLHALTGSENLCLAGGVVLNCLMNREIIRQTPFKNFFIQPIANDAGTSYGAALFHYHQTLGEPRTEIFASPYLGPEFSADEIESALTKAGAKFQKMANIEAAAARAIAAGKIVGWFQGRMESGPRALGNRSILVDPTRAEMKERLNARVKRREGFRPFAPSVLEESCAEYFDLPKGVNSPYMILAGGVRPEMRARLPAVTHVDGTARIQTVSQDLNPRYWRLISEFQKLSGVPVLLNTSFNENEPIVCTPDHAIACFRRTEFDALAIGDFWVTKDDQ